MRKFLKHFDEIAFPVVMVVGWMFLLYCLDAQRCRIEWLEEQAKLDNQAITRLFENDKKLTEHVQALQAKLDGKEIIE